MPSRGPEDWRWLLASPEKHWKAGYSAMAAARSWEEARGLPSEIAAILGDDAELLLAIPEHKVPLPGGQRASQCDVFALARADGGIYALAVEAKVNETFGPTIAEWKPESTKGRTTRLKALCDVLGVSDPPGSLRYQLFHRTAAAIVEASRFKTDAAAMIIQSFSQEHRWYDDFAAFCAFLGVPPARGKPLTCRIANGLPLTLGWATGEARFAEITTPNA